MKVKYQNYNGVRINLAEQQQSFEDDFQISVLVDITEPKMYIFIYLKSLVERQIDRYSVFTINMKSQLQQYSQKYL